MPAFPQNTMEIMTMNDLILSGTGKRLTIGLRNGRLVFGISDREGNVNAVDVPMSAAKRIAEWCGAVPSVGAAPSAMLRVCSKALDAFEEGKFTPETAKELWDRGFDVGSDDCSIAQGDDWIAIYEPASMELEVHLLDDDLGMTHGALVSVGTGQVVLV